MQKTRMNDQYNEVGKCSHNNASINAVIPFKCDKTPTLELSSNVVKQIAKINALSAATLPQRVNYCGKALLVAGTLERDKMLYSSTMF